MNGAQLVRHTNNTPTPPGVEDSEGCRHRNQASLGQPEGGRGGAASGGGGKHGGGREDDDEDAEHEQPEGVVCR